MKILLIAFMAMFSITANAGLIQSDLTGDNAASISANDVLGGGLTANRGGNIIADGAGLGLFDVTFTFLGYEAGYDNDFDFGIGDTNIFSNKGINASEVDDVFTFNNVTMAELLSFRFYSQNSGLEARNLSNTTDTNAGSFASLFNYTHNGIHYDAIVGFDDSGAGADGDYDDLVVGINVSQVPEPASAMLLGLGLAGLGLARKRKQAKEVA